MRKVAALFGALAVFVSGAIVPSVAQAAESQLQITKTAEPGPYGPGDTITYRVQVACSSNTEPCENAAVTDAVPAPLEVQSANVTGVNTNQRTVVIDGNDVTVAFRIASGGTVGLPAGGSGYTVTIVAKVPDTLTWDQLGEIPNTAYATADNAPPVDDSAPVTLTMTENLAADATKSADDHMTGGRPIPAAPGKPVDFVIGGGNTSNVPVDSITLTEPGAGSANLSYLDLTSVGPLTAPAGADQVTVTYTDASGSHTAGTFPTPVADLASVLPGVDLKTLTSTSYTFTNSSGELLRPASGTDDYASIGLAFVTNDSVTGLDANQQVTVRNVVDVAVARGDETATDSDDAAVTIRNTPPSVDVEKVFGRDVLTSGASTTATLRATNGGKDVMTMTILEPAAGQPSLADQGLAFAGFVAAGVEWPADATEATVTYAYSDGTSEEISTTEVDSIPAAPEGKTVVGFGVRFTGDIQAGMQAVLPFTVQAQPLDGTASVTSTNTVYSEVIDSDGQSANDLDSADLTRQPLQVKTTVDKNIVKNELWGVPGASSWVSIAGKVNPDDGTDAGSTVGAEYLQISDPANPQPADPSSDFWNHFDLQSVGPVAVPDNAVMTPQYWNGTGWVDFPGELPVGSGQTWSYTVPSALRDTIQGVRFTFAPAAEGQLLQPGFSVLPYVKVALRDEWRDGTGGAPGGVPDPAESISNDARSEVFNAQASPATDYDDDADAIVLNPIDDGTGPDLVDKSWTPDTVTALSGETATAHLHWGTLGIPMSQVTISDPHSDDELTDVSASVYDAFDLVAIPAITDAAMRFDQVYVERYSADAEDWVPVTSCTEAAPCAGSFDGHTLSPEESADTLGVRFVFSERPDRASVITDPLTDPAVGSGVAETDDLARQIDLQFQLRDFRRSAPEEPVLGTTHSYAYNTGAGFPCGDVTGSTAGVVCNTVNATGEGDRTYSASDGADITIHDVPLNVSLTKRFVDYDATAADGGADVEQVGLPQPGTPASDFPIVTALLTAKNETTVPVRGLSITDPDPGVTGTILDSFNLYAIAGITVPEGTGVTTTVRLEPAIGGETDFTIAQAESLAPEDLATVESVEVLHDGLIDAGATSTVRLEYQLREFRRSAPTTPVAETGATSLPNHAVTQITSPGGVGDGSGENKTIDTAADDLQVVAPTYDVVADKTITPPERFENDPAEGYRVTLRGRPGTLEDGTYTPVTVRTKTITLTDDTPTFWNTYDWAGFANLTLPRPVQRVTVAVLTGATYELDAGELTFDEPGTWTTGTAIDKPSSGLVTGSELLASLPAEIDLSDVRGVRFTFQRVDGSNWERPSNPWVTGAFDATRRTVLLTDSSTSLSTTRPGTQPNPGETALGVTSDELAVEGLGAGPENDPWTADATDTATTLLQHLENTIRVTKVHGNEHGTPPNRFNPGETIPYAITVTNTGRWTMTDMTFEDQIGLDEDGVSLLVEPPVDDENPTSPYTFLLNGSAVTGFAAELDEQTGLLTFTPPAGFAFAPGDVLTITAGLQFRQVPVPVDPETAVDNTITVTADRPFEQCQFTSNGGPLQDKQLGDDGTVVSCESDTVATPAPIAPVQTVKSVKGVGAGLKDADPSDSHYDDLGILDVRGTAWSREQCALADGNAGDGYYRYPCAPLTRPGGLETWRLQMQNEGNIPATTLVAIDVFPAVGDQGVVLTTARESRWTPTFAGNVQVPDLPEGSAFEVWYTTQAVSAGRQTCNQADILAEIGGASGSCASPTVWTTYVEGSLSDEQLAAITALKFVATVPGGIQANQGITVTYDSRTAWYADETAAAPGVDPIAWNSVAAGSQGVFGNETFPSFVTEPLKAGVGLASGRLDLQKDVAGADPAWGVTFPASYPFALTCTSGEGDDAVSVPLVGSDGGDRSVVELPADGTVVRYNDGGTGTWGNVTLPLYANCTIEESPAAQGAQVSFNPVSASAVALRDEISPNVINPAFTGEVALQQITATNIYENAGFTVSKTVDNGGAVDQAGDPIAYPGPFTFTASCTFLGTEVVPESDRTFTLTSDGTPKVFSDLPAGADCTVTETGAGGAASTSVVVTRTGEDPADLDGNVAEFTLEADAADGTHVQSLAFTNHFAVGAVTITKVVDGAGADAWGNEEFRVELVCTLDAADPGQVYSAGYRLSKDEPTWTVGNLPTGADCLVTELQTGGATSTAITPAGGSIMVGDDVDSPVLVTVTNTFETGSVTVSKALAGSPAAGLDPALEGSYTVELVCTRDVDGSELPVTVPGGAQRVITGPASVTYDGLPTGARCTVAEVSSDPPAQNVTVAPAGEFAVGTGTDVDAFQVTVTNEFTNGAIAVRKLVTGDGAALAPQTFTATVTCTWNGTAVDLPDDGKVTLEGNGDAVQIDGIPLGSECSAVEDTEGAGQTTVVDPEPVTVVEGEVAALAITNVYDQTGFTVTKTVDDGGAVDQDGVPVGYTTQFGFTASCTFLGTEVVPEADRTFSLGDGGSKSFTGLPVGADCTITENSDTGGQAATSVVITTGSAPGDPIDGNVAEFALGEGEGTAVAAEFTNHFTVGAVEVTKAVTGPGAEAWGNGQFRVELVCTLEAASSDPVYAAEYSLSKQTPSWTVDNLPAGADCLVTELDSGGATQSSIDPEGGAVVVGDAESGPAVVTVTNEFRVGSLQVRKLVEGPGAPEYSDGPFAFDVVCEFNGVEEAYTGTLTVDGDGSGGALESDVIDGLPVGARCVVTEVDDGGADQTAPPVTVTIPDVDDEGAAQTVVAGFTNAFSAGTLALTKVLDGAGAEEDYATSATFTVQVTCQLEDADGTRLTLFSDAVDIRGGESLGLVDDDGNPVKLPLGTHCFGAETNAGGATASAVNFDSFENAAVIDADDALQELDLVVTNTFGLGSLSLEKLLAGGGADGASELTFTLALTCVLDQGQGAPTTVVDAAEVTIVGGEVVEIGDLPIGARCWVAETDDGGAASTEISHASAQGAAVVGDTTVVRVTNTFDAVPTSPTGKHPVTGIAVSGLLILGGLLALGGSTLVIARRRRESVLAHGAE